MVDSVPLMFYSPVNGTHQVHVFCDGELTGDCHNDHHTQAPHKCSCGKCSSVALFEQSCPLAYDPLTLVSRSASIGYYESASVTNSILQSDLDEDGNSTRTALPTLRGPYKSVRHNQAETTRNPVDVANLVLLLLMLSGDVELNPGPPGTSKLQKLIINNACCAQ